MGEGRRRLVAQRGQQFLARRRRRRRQETQEQIAVGAQRVEALQRAELVIGHVRQRRLYLLDVLGVVDRQGGSEIELGIVDHRRDGLREGVVRLLDRGNRLFTLGE